MKILKIISVLILICILIAGNVSAATLMWNSSSGTVEGYKVYYGTNANPSSSVDVGNVTNYNIDTLGLSENVQYYFCVSAYNTAGESAPCSPVGYTPADTTPPVPPIGLVVE